MKKSVENNLEVWAKRNNKEYLLKEWSEKNSINPINVAPFSSKTAIWKCSKCKQEWEALISNRSKGAGCPVCCNYKIIPGINDLETWCKKNNKEYLLKEWSNENSIKPSQIAPKSLTTIKWECLPYKHKWEAKITYRTVNNNNCPFCANKRVLPGFNDLETWCKKNNKEYLLKEWDKTNSLAPSQVLPMTANSVFWKCNKYGHVYKMAISGKTANGNGCPICSGKIVLPGFNDLETWCKKNNKEYLLKEWSNENAKKTYEVAPFSMNRVIWQCQKCKQKWSSSVANRTSHDNNCPICSNRKVAVGINDLETWCKKNNKEYLLKEWSSKNITKPSEVLPGSHTKVFWSCDKCKGEYKTPIYFRTLSNTSCPICHSSTIVSGINDFYTWCSNNNHKYLLDEWSPKNKIDPKTIPKTYAGKVIWKCSKCSQEWEANVGNRTNNGAGCPVCAKKILVKGYNDFETWCKKNNKEYLLDEWDEFHNGKPSDYPFYYSRKVSWYCGKCNYKWRLGLAYRANNNAKCPSCSGKIARYGINDFETWCKKNNKEHLLKEWSPKNKLLPSEVLKSSSIKYNWNCSKCGYEYKAAPYARSVRGYNCPSCSNRILVVGRNDFETWCKKNNKEHLLKEWSPKNLFKPSNVTMYSITNVTWICSNCNYQWNATVYQRAYSNLKCPVCTNRIIKQGFNDLETWCKRNNKTLIINEWDFDLNMALGLKPTSIGTNTDVPVWWKCHNCGKKYCYPISLKIYKANREQETCPFCLGINHNIAHFM